jgi:putative spermidine/putrescine transport system ATP-binding protein
MTVRGQQFTELRLEGVSRSYGGHAALVGLDLTIRCGEFVALLGPSGCGKTTALNCVAGLLPLTGGSIWLDDKRIDGLPPERRDFGMVFQNYALFPHMSVRSNIAFGLRMHKVAKAERNRRVDEAIKLVQLHEHAAKFPGQLSGGQQQRVAIARAVALQPPLVLMDEPLSNLDARLRLEMRVEIRRLHQSLGLTTVYVTHDQEEALSLADRLVVLRDGSVQQIGTPEEVYAHPANRYVAGFMGYRNMFELDVIESEQNRIVLGADGMKLRGVNCDGVSSGRAIAAIRPEDFVVGDADGNRLEAIAEVVEYHGRNQSVEGKLRSGERVQFHTTERLAPGDEVTLSVPEERVLVFSLDTPAAPVEAAG